MSSANSLLTVHRIGRSGRVRQVICDSWGSDGVFSLVQTGGPWCHALTLDRLNLRLAKTVAIVTNGPEFCSTLV
ncbi:MAG: hypothetical protein DRO73_11155 [Candidatus Thorarchaeota archaeon]|nr:MAG: hypothetical protein DRO73_11155 [Candidatus Thorarchaeota archaeon]